MALSSMVGREKKQGMGVGGWGGSSTRPTHPVQSCPIKRAQRWKGVGGVDVDYKGGASCRRADDRVCGGEEG